MISFLPSTLLSSNMLPPLMLPDGVLPDDVLWWQALLVIIVAGLASALTAALGIGGGLVLLACMSLLLPAGAVIPVHGVAQLGSNGGRVVLQYRHVAWPIFMWFTLGGLLGTVLGSQLVVDLPPSLLRFGVGGFVLISLWADKFGFNGGKFKVGKSGARAFFSVGAIGAFLTLFFGATGPLAAAVLRRAEIARFAMVATHGACMVAQHLMKVIAFGALGFVYAPWLPLIVMIVFAGFAGTVIGLRLLYKMPEERFKFGFKWVLTIIAFYLLISAGLEWV